MTDPAIVAIVFNEGVMQDILIDGWPASMPLPT